MSPLAQKPVGSWNSRAHVPERAARESLVADDAAGERDFFSEIGDDRCFSHELVSFSVIFRRNHFFFGKLASQPSIFWTSLGIPILE